MPDLDTAEYRKLALIAAGVPLGSIPPIIDTATWRHMLIAALIKNTANQVISGSVDYFSQLPTTVGSPSIGATWLVRNSSGIYYINYRSAGVYMKVTDTGSASDWVYIPMSAVGTLPDVTLTNPQVGDMLSWDGSKWVNGKKFVQYQYLPSNYSISSSSGGPSQFSISIPNSVGKTYLFKWNVGISGTATVTATARFYEATVLGGISSSCLPNEAIRTFVGGTIGNSWTIANSTNTGSVIIEAIAQPTSNAIFDVTLFLQGSTAFTSSARAGSWFLAQEI
jgi:hypothetical protein